MRRQERVKSMHKRKRGALLAQLLALMCLLGGCAGQVEERPLAAKDAASIKPGAEAPLADSASDLDVVQMLYFINQEGTALVPVSRKETVSGAQTNLRAALDALLQGPSEDEKEAFWPDIEGVHASAGLRVSGRFAEVDLPSRYRLLPPETLYVVRQAVAETVCAAGADSVSVLVGGREEGLDLAATLPAGVFTRVSGMELASRYALFEDEKRGGEPFVRMAVIYLPSADGQLLFPVLRNVSCASATPVECLYALLAEMGRTDSRSEETAAIPAPLSYLEEMPDVVRTGDGAYRIIRLHFADSLTGALSAAGCPLPIYLAAMTETLMGFVPGVDGLQITIGRRVLTELSFEAQGKSARFADGVLTRSSLPDLLGAYQTVYVPDGESGRLRRSSVPVPAGKATDARRMLENSILSLQQSRLLPDTLDGQDIYAIRTERSDFVVNLSERFRDVLLGMPERQAAMAVYAMVNTMTEGRRQKGVVFFFAGKQVDGFAGGMTLRGRMLRNPGIVKQ